ncbi:MULTISPECIES: hypothetical protein [Cupriavidus]|uniref:Uncharacterized protein n=1 Tax=Cupriavidus pauculus TaxID=82633 RepID=A0A3G8H1T5_9BURK|nr:MULTISPECIES: hypothetical protein [Cupriavidus]AZG14481.1 hypothetical protein EHF44_14130 [Cupriavidus pauculus]MBY4732172.1 hypothetical protein [Cupriavidus pauculus]
MYESKDEIVFAPSIDWFKGKAKKLRKRIGQDLVTHTFCLDLLAKIYGFFNWKDFCAFKLSDDEYETFWDAELDAKTLDERRYLQSSSLMMALGMSEVEALRVLDDVGVSRKPEKARTKLQTAPEIATNLYVEEQPKLNQGAEINRELARQPLVSYKKRHLISCSLPSASS